MGAASASFAASLPCRMSARVLTIGVAVALLAAFGAASSSTRADLAAAAPPAPPDVGAGPPAPIERLNDTLIDIMKRSDDLGYQGRYDVMAPVVRETFDVPFMAAKSIGRTWRKLGAEDRERWVAAFEGYTVSNLADRFDGFSGESLEIVGEKPASHETRVVLTLLTRPGDDDVELNYRMREGDGGWRVVDIYSDGKVSEIALRRSEYASVLKQGGIEKLIASVNAKTAERARGD